MIAVEVKSLSLIFFAFFFFLQANDTSNTTLYVSRLHHKLGFKQFNMHFAEFGKVTKCYLSETGREHHNKGFGFVTYETEQDMKKALEAQHEVITLISSFCELGSISWGNLPRKNCWFLPLPY